MIGWLKRKFGDSEKKRERVIIEAVHEARMENAQRDLAALQARGDKAVDTLRSRHQRNHWGEAIEEMILGVRH